MCSCVLGLARHSDSGDKSDVEDGLANIFQEFAFLSGFYP